MPGEDSILSAASQGFGQLTGVAQLIGSFSSAKKANANLNKLFKKRKAFQTPDEIFDILNMRENNVAGYSPETLSYLTGNSNAALSSALGAASRLGGDPNNFASLLDNYSKDIFRIGNENELLKLKQYDNVAGALQLVAQNEEAEWLSRENLIKDQMQSEADKLKTANQGIQSGLNLVTNATAAAGSGNAYGSGSTPSYSTAQPASLGSGGATTNQIMPGMTPSQLQRLKALLGD